MMERLFTLLVMMLLARSAASQQQTHAVALAVHAPFGTFSHTHLTGFGTDYTWMPAARATTKALSLVLNGGADYFFGKKETVAGYEFRNGGYFSAYVMAGGLYQPVSVYNVLLAAGPSLGLYKGGPDAGAAFRLSGAMRLADRWSVGPSIFLRQHINTKALWTVSIRASVGIK